MTGSWVQARFFDHIWRREAESDMIQRIWLEPDDPQIKIYQSWQELLHTVFHTVWGMGLNENEKKKKKKKNMVKP